MRTMLFVILTALLTAGCRKAESSAGWEAEIMSERDRSRNTDPRDDPGMAELPEWIVAAHSTIAVKKGKLDLGFYGERRIDEARCQELLATLTKANRLGDLEVFCVTMSPIEDDSFREWAKVAQQGKLTSLRYLGFGGTQVGDESVLEWAKAAQSGKLEALTTLQLFDTKITDRSMVEWARAAQDGKLKNLSELWLIQTSVGDESMTAWAKAAQSGHLKKMERLALRKTQVGDATFTQWKRAADDGKLPKLLTFWLTDTNLKRLDVGGRKVEIPEEYLWMGQAQELFAWARKQR